MQRRHLILRLKRAVQTRNPFGGFSPQWFQPGLRGLREDSLHPEVVAEDLSHKDLYDLARDPSVAAIAPDMPIRLVDASPSATASAWGVAAVGADQSQRDGSGVLVAVLDTGIDTGHVAFQGVQLEEKDFTGTGNGDGQGHGTHCAGTIFGRKVGSTRIGVAPGVEHALIAKVLDNNGSGRAEWLYSAMFWAFERRARVISMSLGFDYPGLVAELIASGRRPEVATSLALEAFRANAKFFDALMEFARARETIDGGVVVVAAAGNESARSDPQPYVIATSLPAAADDVVSVGAIGRAGPGFRIADFSNTLVDVSGPGVDVLSAKLGGGTTGLSGTSMATPHVAGVATLWWQALQTLGAPLQATNVKARLLATARTNVFVPPDDPADRGAGLVTAPE